ncbi:MAG: anhydro-N-acetylmuramic acid kinase, partial [Sulfurimonas sp.]|uniref:anhydro-N-acetylmuramic acid kinase n=1 Tax=Sulfurimonas sp. TaxID=2022749 RepID=UPI0026367DF2
MSEFYIGVMSGTSLDGIDIAYCEIEDDSFKLLASAAYHFDTELKSDILDAINTQTTLKNIGEIDSRLGKMYADALEMFIKEKNIEASKVRAIGLHGQTLWHEPESQNPFSMQLGNANIIT